MPADRLNFNNSQSGIADLAQWIQSGGFQFGDVSDKPAVVIKSYLTHFGRLPTPDEVSQALPQFTGPNGDAYVASLAQQNKYQDQIQKAIDAQMQQQKGINQDTLGKTQELYKQNLGDIQKSITDYYSPSGQGGQKLMGDFNNLGLLNSGAFSEGLGNAVAGAQENFQLPALLEMMNLPQEGGQVQSGLGLEGLQNTLFPSQQGAQLPYQLQNQGFDWQQFMAKTDLARQLAEESQPSAFSRDFSMATSGLSGAGQAALGGAALKKSGATWICTAMIKHQVLGRYEVNRLHEHLFKSFRKRFWKFMEYFIIGKPVVWMAESKGVNWEDWRPFFYDQVIAQEDSLKAVDLYEQAFWKLVRWIFSPSKEPLWL